MSLKIRKNQIKNLANGSDAQDAVTFSQASAMSAQIVTPYSGTTNASGQYTVTFPVAYSVAPNIQANIVGGSDSQIIRLMSVSTTGFTVTVRNRTDIVGLLPTWANVNGATVDVLITKK